MAFALKKGTRANERLTSEKIFSRDVISNDALFDNIVINTSSTLNGNTTINDVLTVSGTTTITDTLNVIGTQNISGELNISGSQYIDGTLDVTDTITTDILNAGTGIIDEVVTNIISAQDGNGIVVNCNIDASGRTIYCENLIVTDELVQSNIIKIEDVVVNADRTLMEGDVTIKSDDPTTELSCFVVSNFENVVNINNTLNCDNGVFDDISVQNISGENAYFNNVSTNVLNIDNLTVNNLATISGLHVEHDARIDGSLNIGPASITLWEDNDKLHIQNSSGDRITICGNDISCGDIYSNVINSNVVSIGSLPVKINQSTDAWGNQVLNIYNDVNGSGIILNLNNNNIATLTTSQSDSLYIYTNGGGLNTYSNQTQSWGYVRSGSIDVFDGYLNMRGGEIYTGGGDITTHLANGGTGNIHCGDISASSINVSTGNITGGDITGSSLNVGAGNITGGSLNVGTGNITGGSLTLNGNSAYPLKKYNINMSDGIHDNLHFYPVEISNPPTAFTHYINIYKGTQESGNIYNEQSIHGIVKNGGWTDQNPPFVDIIHELYDQLEHTVYGIYGGTKRHYQIVVYLRGGYNYTIDTYDNNVTLKDDASGYLYDNNITDVTWDYDICSGSWEFIGSYYPLIRETSYLSNVFNIDSSLNIVDPSGNSYLFDDLCNTRLLFDGYNHNGKYTTLPSINLRVGATQGSPDYRETISSNDVLGRIEFGAEYGLGGYKQYPASIVALAESDFYTDSSGRNDNISSKLEFRTLPITNDLNNDSSSPITRMTINKDGNVGIGIDPSSYKFDVSGDGRVRGDFRVDGSFNIGPASITMWEDNDKLHIKNSNNKGITISGNTLTSYGDDNGITFNTILKQSPSSYYDLSNDDTNIVTYLFLKQYLEYMEDLNDLSTFLITDYTILHPQVGLVSPNIVNSHIFNSNDYLYYNIINVSVPSNKIYLKKIHIDTYLNYTRNTSSDPEYGLRVFDLVDHSITNGDTDISLGDVDYIKTNSKYNTILNTEMITTSYYGYNSPEPTTVVEGSPYTYKEITFPGNGMLFNNGITMVFHRINNTDWQSIQNYKVYIKFYYKIV